MCNNLVMLTKCISVLTVVCKNRCFCQWIIAIVINMFCQSNIPCVFCCHLLALVQIISRILSNFAENWTTMNEVRIDKWLWATRIFKTRTIATDACKLGRVTIGGMNVKPSRLVKPGDVIAVRKPPVTYTFEVLAVLNNRVGAKLVPNYLRNITTRDQLELLEMVKIDGFVNRQKGMGRPTKKDGREMKEFTDEAFFGFDDAFDWDDDDNPLWTQEDEARLEQK